MKSQRQYAFAAPTETAVFHMRFRRERVGELGHYEALASGFFISGWGLFATARHCVTVSDGSLHDHRDIEVLVRTPRGLVGCSVLGLACHENADLAIGIIGRPSAELRREYSFKTCALRISKELPESGEPLMSFGWANTHLSQEYPGGDVNHNLENGTFDGEFVAFRPNGFTLSKGPCLEHTIPTIGQMSGSPVIRVSTCSVVGINSTGTESYGVATDVRLLLDLTIPFGPNEIRGRRLADVLHDEGL